MNESALHLDPKKTNVQRRDHTNFARNSRQRIQSFFKRSKRFKRFKRFKRKNVDDEGNRKKYKNTEKQHENGKYDKWVVLIKPHNGCDAFRILIRNCK